MPLHHPTQHHHKTYHRLVTEHRGAVLKDSGEGHADLQLSQSHTDTVPWSHPKRQEGEGMPSRFGLWCVSRVRESLQNDSVITTIVVTISNSSIRLRKVSV